MSGFSPADRVDVDNQFRALARGLHELGGDWAEALRQIVVREQCVLAARGISPGSDDVSTPGPQL